MTYSHSHNTSQSGVILITTLWILLILSVIALGFSIDLQLEARLARNQMDTHQAYYLARAGIVRAMVELKNDALLDHKSKTTIYDGLSDCWATNEDTEKIFKNVELEDGKYTVTVVDELSKLNINKASAKMFEGLFRALEFDEDDSKYFALAIVDYRDVDQSYNLDTTYTEEGFYYNNTDTTKAPEHFKNADFTSPEELLKVPGMTPSILYKKRKLYGHPDVQVALIDLLTVHGNGLVNVNTAILPVLTAIILSLSEEDVDNSITIAQKIIDHRDGSDGEPGTTDDKPYTNPAEVGNDMGTSNAVLASAIVQALRTNTDMFNIISVGEISRSKTTVQSLVKREWVVTQLTDEERREFENENKGIKEGVKLQTLNWMEY